MVKHFVSELCVKQISFNDSDLVFNHTTFKTILKDIYNDPCKVTRLSMSDIVEIMELTDNSIKLKKDIVIIYYYGEIRLIGYNQTIEQFEIFNLPSQFENILKNTDCFCFYESTIMTLLDSQFEEIDFFFSSENYTFDNNEHIMYYIFP